MSETWKRENAFPNNSFRKQANSECQPTHTETLQQMVKPWASLDTFHWGICPVCMCCIPVKDYLDFFTKKFSQCWQKIGCFLLQSIQHSWNVPCSESVHIYIIITVHIYIIIITFYCWRMQMCTKGLLFAHRLMSFLPWGILRMFIYLQLINLNIFTLPQLLQWEYGSGLSKGSWYCTNYRLFHMEQALKHF